MEDYKLYHFITVNDMMAEFCMGRWDEIRKQYEEGLITGGEMFMKMVDVWLRWREK